MMFVQNLFICIYSYKITHISLLAGILQAEKEKKCFTLNMVIMQTYLEFLHLIPQE